MRYNRASESDTVRVARLNAAQHDATRYVYATAYGYTIDAAPPPGMQAHLIVYPDGAVTEQHPIYELDGYQDAPHPDLVAAAARADQKTLF